MPRIVATRPSAVVVVCSIAILCSSVVARAQTVDPGFNPGANQIVEALAVQPDGKILVGGGFTGLGGGTGTTPINHIGRINPDGNVDLSFNAGANATVHAVTVQPDGKILVGGNFTTLGVGGGIVSRSRIGRFNADGSVDATFNPGANGNVYALIVQQDGKILVGGEFSTIGGGTRNRLARLSPTGVPDSFDPGVSKPGASAIVYTMALQADGKVVVGGYFNGLGGGTGNSLRNFIGRINADGTLDTGFNPGANSIGGVNALALQADGSILVGGSFTGLGNGTGATLRGNIGRLFADGQVDPGFNPGAESQVLTLGVQVDGKILIGGYFKWLGGAGNPTIRSVRNYIGRLNPSGAVDTSFNPGANNIVNAVAAQADGAILAGGVFTFVGDGTGLSTPRNRIARFPATEAAIQTLSLIGGRTVVTWARSGAGPEVSRVTFESSTNGGVSYTLLGNGTRTSGGWEMTGLGLPSQKVTIRARGYFGSGFQTGSGSIVESIMTEGISSKATGDFDGDGKTDVAIYRPSTGTWWMLQSTNGVVSSPWGVSTDILVPGDYDGDGKTDVAVFRPSAATWYINRSSAGVLITAWGVSTDVPVPGDYDGDGKTDIAVIRPSTGTWYILKSSDQSFLAQAWGISSDVAVPADYDGDGKTDVAVFRTTTGTWYILRSSDQSFTAQAWGTSSDIPVPGDYDGDGKADVAVFRTGTWYILKSSDMSFNAISWGTSTDVPVPGDYDGDGKTDTAVFRPSSGTWFILGSNAGYVSFTWGTSTDIPMNKRP